DSAAAAGSATAEDSDAVLARMQELIDEANRSDERVALLEEMLYVAEEAKRFEEEERAQLETWVGDIENRVSQREEEHRAELDALRQRLEESNQQRDQLQVHLRQAAAAGGRAPEHYEATLENLQQQNAELQERAAAIEKENHLLKRKVEQQAEEQENLLREERVNLAKEQAKVSRMRFELSNQVADIDQMPKTENSLDKETAHKIRTLREHLREIHEQEKQEAKEASLATRLARLWKRVEY
ncbi:MAG: hypothetical protein MI861_04485, partial [Pirellulales bacterium]|nr:hypothetical protein [Pirellulales bacterium]